MTNNYYILFHLANYLNKTLQHLSIREVYSQEKNKIVIAFDNFSLEFSADRNLPYLILKENYERAHRNSVSLFEFLCGKTVSGAELYNNDRIICVQLDGGIKLMFTFIPSKLNLIALSGSRNIIESFKKTGSERFDDYLITKQYAPKKYSTIGGYINGTYPGIDKNLRNEIIKLNAVNIMEPLSSISEGLADKIFTDAEKKLKQEIFRIFESENDILYVIDGMDFTQEFPDINSMLLYYIKRKLTIYNIVNIKERLLGDLRNKIQRTEKKINNLRLQSAELELNKDLMIKGNLILANLEGIKNYNSAVKLQDPLSGIMYEIKLDSRKSAVENAQNYFRKYKMGKEALSLIENKTKYYEYQKKELENKTSEISSLEDYKSIKKMDKENIKDKQSGETDTLFRKFKIDEQFEIWVGKDSRSNDLLTTKYSSQNDLWFHIRGFSGSHTVLKRNSKDAPVPKEYIHYAASIAAYYSKARNAGTVPVAYCEKKYVKKQKGFKEGTVTMEREKIVNVKPAIPELFQKFLSKS